MLKSIQKIIFFQKLVLFLTKFNKAKCEVYAVFILKRLILQLKIIFMKKVLFILSILFGLSFASFAQEEAPIKKEKKVKKFLESEGKDRLFLVLNHDNLFHQETNGFATQWYSRGMGLYFMWDFQIKKSKFSVAPGIGYNHAAYFHNGIILEDSTGISFPEIVNLSEDENFSRAKMSLHYIEVPIELRFRHKFKNALSLKIAVGIKGSVKVGAGTKEVKTGPNGYNKHYDVTNYKDFNTWRVGPTFRLGYGFANLIMYYDLLPLFKEGRGPKMTPFSIGFAFTTL